MPGEWSTGGHDVLVQGLERAKAFQRRAALLLEARKLGVKRAAGPQLTLTKMSEQRLQYRPLQRRDRRVIDQVTGPCCVQRLRPHQGLGRSIVGEAGYRH